MSFKPTNLDKIAYFFLIILFAFGVYYGFTNLDYFNNSFTKEDGFVEWSTAIFLFLISMLSFYRLVTLGKSKKTLWIIGTIGFALIFLFGAGEEISWGQRIFGIESGTFFKKNNAQQETNLHNLVVEGTKINRLIFSNLLTIIMILYLIVSPFLYKKYDAIKTLFDKFAVPIVRAHHAIAFIISTVLVLIIPSKRKWEIYELVFGLIFLLIFISPYNKHIFSKEK
jgi:hypothetical protein